MFKITSNGLDAMTKDKKIIINPPKKPGRFPNLNGAPPTYNPETLPNIIQAVFDLRGSLSQVAWRMGLHKVTFNDWIRLGDLDLQNGIESNYAQLSYEVRRTQADVVQILVDEVIKHGNKNAKFIQWYLSAVFRADFGLDAAVMEALLERALKMENSLARLQAAGTLDIIDQTDSKP